MQLREKIKNKDCKAVHKTRWVMNDKQKDDIGPGIFFGDWIKTSMAFWESMVSMWPNIHAAGSHTRDSKREGKTSRFQTSWESTQKTWQAWSRIVSEPETMETIFNDTGELPEIFLKIAQTCVSSFVRLQQQWLEKAGRVQDSTKSFRFENIGEDAVKIWTQLYETELRKIFNMPQIGLTRFYQEKMNQTIDKYNIFQTRVTAFLQILSLPVEKSFQVMQEKLTELADEGLLPEGSKAYYQMWIKILEGHYMTLFQSVEYTEILNQTLYAMSEFSEAKKELLQSTLLYMLPVPTQKEMDELYKEIYLLKKRIKALEKRS
jgi:poly[(R)-3-hydroxyalkanoate] polymerase subunit PhaE